METNLQIQQNQIQLPKEDTNPNGAQKPVQATPQKNVEDVNESNKIQNQDATLKILSFQEELNQMIAPTEFECLVPDFDFATEVNFETQEITEEDAKFFLKIVEENKIVQLPLVVSDILNNAITVEEVQKAGATNKITDALKTAIEKNKPVRFDFDNNITLVLRVDKEGKINAQFYPNDKIAEEYLKNNIPYLRTRFDEQKISYAQLDYGTRRHNNGKQNQEDKK